MTIRILLLMALMTGLLATGCSKHSPPAARVKKMVYPKADALQAIDFGQFYKGPISKNPGGFSRRQIIDGLPFHLDSKIILYGQSQANWDKRANPAADAGARYPDLTGVPVGRQFHELHVIHSTAWPDVEGETVAVIRLHYDDGTACDFPIIYGAHVRDHQRIRTEESETMSDPDTKIVWRGPGIADFKSTARAFESKFINPHPLKTVQTMDVVSTHHLASYQLQALTVADLDYHRAVTDPFPATEPERHFADTLTVQVRDRATGQPVKGALVRPFMDTDGPYMVTAPFYTDENGDGVIRYPKARTAHISLNVGMKGYANGYASWANDFPATNIIQLTPTSVP
jgi:hypothetical protein